MKNADQPEQPKGHSSRYRILFPNPDDGREEIKNVSHWLFSMNGLDYLVFYKDGKIGRGFSRHQEFPPQWKYVNDRLKSQRV